MASAQGIQQRDNARPFVLTRSFFAGSQKFGAVWTGDNEAKWSHLKAASPMLLSMSIAGITFSGADVGGFFGDPEPELLLRWYQVAAFQPFFRGHAHVDSKRREPWLFGEPYTTNIRAAIRQVLNPSTLLTTHVRPLDAHILHNLQRYAFLPYVYSLFQHAASTGTPVMRPLWLEFPKDKQLFGVEQEFMLGGALLVAPIFSAGATSTSVYLPMGTVW
jgi:alpha-glucosidase (family GH31 glycosyl hydrolase)